MDGWIKLHRKLLLSTIFSNEKLLKFWIWCLLKASHKPNIQRVGLQEVEIKKGQFVFGRTEAARELKMSESYVYKVLKQFEKEQLLVLNSNNKFTVVTIVNWESYQSIDTDAEQQSNNKVTTKEQQSNTNKNVKNVKNVKNKKEYTCAFEEFWKNYPRRIDKGNAYKFWTTRLKDGYAEDDLIKAAVNYAGECKANNTDKKYIKHPKTFLSSTAPFLDYLKGEEDASTGRNTKPHKKGLVEQAIERGLGTDFDGF